MRDSKPITFVRRCNDDWTVHSYCSRCFATIADGTTAEVTTAECEHVCDPSLLEMVEEYRRVSHLLSAA